MYKIIVSDLDGTLLTSQYNITDFTKKILLLLISKGVHFIFATGRHYIDVFKISDNLNIKSYMITSNGSQIYNQKKELIFNQFLLKEIAISLCKIRYIDKEIMTHLYCNHQWYTNSSCSKKNIFCKKLFLKNKIFNLENFCFDKVNKIFFTSNNIKKLKLLEQEILEIWSNKKNINIFFSFPECLEIVPCGVSKGSALNIILKLIGYSLSDCISFGDGMNDQDMLNISGKGCIMKNADPCLKLALPHLEIIGDNNNNGLAHYLCKIFHINI
ncbi:Pyridoxal phosphate phosphatase YigL [Buchnera aphidicola (Eriosoma grossulariae)]|uniref:Cof-type HAD-IIB family hydrolase n=1 Tax=Buchnera aphidicola TaxID=9 RepID=UPI003463AF87